MSREISVLPLVTVVLPVFNGGAYLLPAVQSIRNQSFRDWELLLIDDGSTDHAVEGVIALGDSRITLIQDGKNKGLATRLNEGVKLAKGKYIARMDADDLAFPERLMRQFQFLELNPDVDLLGCRIAVFRAGKTPLVSGGNFTHQEICARPWRGFPLAHPTWMGRASWFRKFGYALPECVRAEDQELLLRSHFTSRFFCLDEVLLAYRQFDFRFRKTQLARISFLKAQIRIFLTQGLWHSLFLAIFYYCVKTGVDLLATLPGCERLFFKRMGTLAPPELIDQLKGLGVD